MPTPRSTTGGPAESSMSCGARTQPVTLAVLLVKSPSPDTLTAAPANIEPATVPVADTVRRRVAPDGRLAMVQVTEYALALQLAPGMLADVTGWLTLSASVALVSGSARRLGPSAYNSTGDPRSASVVLEDSASAASTPERIETDSWRLLFEVTRS